MIARNIFNLAKVSTVHYMFTAHLSLGHKVDDLIEFAYIEIITDAYSQ